jgi:chromosome segregation ATPase
MMSTAGKVLVGVVILALVGWIVLFSLVYELNTNWGQELDRLASQIEKLEKDNEAQTAALETALADLSREQLQRDTDVEVLRGLLSDAEKLAAQNQEAAERVRLQLSGLESALREASDRVQHRVEQKEQTQQELAEAEATVKTLQDQVKTQLETLSGLRQSFLETMEENRTLLERLRTSSGGRSAMRMEESLRR